MKYEKNKLILENRDEFCVVRFICTNKNLKELIEYFDGKQIQDLFSDLNDFFCQFFSYRGDNRSLKYIYDKNVNSSTFFEKNPRNIVGSTSEDFMSKSKANRLFLFEMIYQPNEDSANSFDEFCDPVSFIYVKILHEILTRCGDEHAFMLFSDNEINCYSPVEESEYFKLKDFLCFNSGSLNDRIRILRMKDTNWNRLFTDVTVGQIQKLGKICPLFDITDRTYLDLQKRFNDSEQKAIMINVVNYYLSEIKQLFEKYKVAFDLDSYYKSDSVIEALLFACTVMYIVRDLEERIDKIARGKRDKQQKRATKEEIEQKTKEIGNRLRKYDFALMHERCVDYAQGILQLIENAYLHAISNNSKAKGYWCIRVREKRNTISLVENSNHSSHASYNSVDDLDAYYLEVYVVDYTIDCNSQNGIVTKFYENIEKRLNDLTDENCKEYRCLQKLVNGRSSNPVILENMFGVGNEHVDLKEYLSLPENVAWHYGLQILDNVVLTGSGCLYVTSGIDSYKTKDQDNYIKSTVPWSNGTAYIIVLPIQLYEESRINYTDTIDTVDEGENDGVTNFVEYKFMERLGITINQGKMDTSSPKNSLVLNMVELLSEETEINDNLYIDCCHINNHFMMEILAKTIFLCFAKTNLKNVALINLSNQLEVIKLFRQFAMFYDRFGNNSIMKDKSIFITDDNAIIDILLCGSISSIKHCLYNNQISGGLNEEVMKIIKYLSKRGS